MRISAPTRIGLGIDISVSFTQALLSLTLKVCKPLPNPLKVLAAPKLPEPIAYVYGASPPEPVTTTTALVSLWHFGGVSIALMPGVGGGNITREVSLKQVSALLTLMVYVPGDKLSVCTPVTLVKLCTCVLPCNTCKRQGEGETEGVMVKTAFFAQVAGEVIANATVGLGSTLIVYAIVCLDASGQPWSV